MPAATAMVFTRAGMLHEKTNNTTSNATLRNRSKATPPYLLFISVSTNVAQPDRFCNYVALRQIRGFSVLY
jgi:hypothetical protein